MYTHFKNLLLKHQFDELCYQYWGKNHFFQKNAISAPSFDLLSERTIEILLSQDEFYKNSHVILKNKDYKRNRCAVDYLDTLQGLSNEMSIQIRHLEQHLGPSDNLVQFGRELEQFLKHRLESISLFISPPYAQALPSHTDNAHIFTLQIIGNKSWAIFNLEQNEDYNSVVLSPGDLLYVPPEIQHQVKSMGNISVSVAFVFQPITYEILLSSFYENLELNKILSKRIPNPRWEQDEIKSELTNSYSELVTCFEKYLRELTPEKLMEHITKRTLGIIPKPARPLYLTDISFTEHSKICKTEFDSYITIKNNKVILYTSGNLKIPLTHDFLRPLEWFLSQNCSFYPYEVPKDIDKTILMKLLEILHQHGLIRIQSKNLELEDGKY